MTLYISDKNSKTVINYFIITIFCIVFSLIYRIFSHSVTSTFMTFMFVFPLFGMISSLIIYKNINIKIIPKDITKKLFRCGIATLTIGSCVRGIFDIYGTSVNLIILYWIFGTALLIISLITWIITIKAVYSAS